MMRRKTFLSAIGVSAALATTAVADIQTFRFGLVDACVNSIPNLDTVMPTLNNGAWLRYQGAGEGEFELLSGSTHMFLNLASANGECTVMDSAVSKKQAVKILETALDDFVNTNGARYWANGVGDYGEPVWFLDLGSMFPNPITVSFSIDDGLDGGAAISFQIDQ